MGSGWERKKILMVVKTYPAPSKKYNEIVCTAGITEEGQWIRLYPMKFRHLNPEQKFSKYTWIEADVKRNTRDSRSESYLIDETSIKILKHLSSTKDLEERKKYLLPLCQPDLEHIKRLYKADNISLGIFKPKEVLDFIIEEDDPEWKANQVNYLNQMSLFDKNFRILQKIPWRFSYKFTCDNQQCTGHNIIITDWELFQAYRNFRGHYKDEKEALKKLKEKWLDFFTDSRRESYFIVGTVNPWPTFIILGVFTYLAEKKSQQMSLFD